MQSYKTFLIFTPIQAKKSKALIGGLKLTRNAMARQPAQRLLITKKLARNLPVWVLSITFAR